ncbi:MAG: Cell envelope-related transcriptional attenuator [Microgenomates group bacterium Gr01-1014_7]|nr:MAG: Cell envelope-related transcriptional attenuator [Microgenomates group bacterium Gr01-1014_7]
MKRINLQPGERSNPIKVRKVKRIITKLFPFVLVISLLTVLSIFLITLSGSNTVINFNWPGNPFKSTGGRVNILLLGIAGGTHDGSNLTDTIMVASYNFKTSQVYLISIPRDLWLPALRTKANAVYQMGMNQNNGLGFSKTIMGNVLGIPIHYGLRIDFRGFVAAINTLDGIDVLVDRSFDDYNYPIEGKENDLCGFEEKEIDFSENQAKQLNIDPGKRKVFVAPDGKIATDSAEEDKGIQYFSCRYEHVSFKEGLTHMDGETALNFVRSRHGTNGEGSDFARSKRQEKALQATREKALSLETLFNPEKISGLIKTLGKSIDTDISVKEGLEFYKLLKNLNKTHNFVLDDSLRTGFPLGRSSLLIHPPASDYGGAYVLVSQDDDFSIIQGYIRKLLNGEVENESSASARSGN